MTIPFPSREFDEAVAAVCHGTITDGQAQGLNALLRNSAAARDEYLLRVELHSRLASQPDLFPGAGTNSAPTHRSGLDSTPPRKLLPPQPRRHAWVQRSAWTAALAASLVLVVVGWWEWRRWNTKERTGATSNAVAMLNRVVDVEWTPGAGIPRPGAPLEPGWLRLKSGLAQIVFYSGARLAIQGPAEIELVSQGEATCRSGRLTAEVPPPARGFKVGTPQLSVTDLGTSFGLEVTNRRTELHVFRGTVEWRTAANGIGQDLREGGGALVEDSRRPRFMAANPELFASLFDLQSRSMAAESTRLDQWREASERLNRDPSLLVHLDFEHAASPDWRLQNEATRTVTVPDATLVGGEWTTGRWPGKRALEFQNVNDRVRLGVPGEFDALTLAMWVRVQGLDRQMNSLFMCDGFDPGTVHWLIRDDGVLGLTVIGRGPGNYQIAVSAPVITLDRLGMWLHLAVVLDGRSRRVTHYLNGVSVDDKALKIAPPFRVGPTELGNWNARGLQDKVPALMRNFSGAMDEFLLFSRALSAAEIRALYSEGTPQADHPMAATEASRRPAHP